ncbi:MAG: cob(I)yrinic acid a,c-diamide adenosyltransferase, partial [Candidatus Yonathbacteria bacterium]|nr:cob(I)yrinic acid a,c-diamide adenosyltransferase [Candidatus Yonathbacteria bacterium]
MLYTRKGDKGDTGIFGCDQRFSKSSAIAEALGTLDEVNSFLGVCKMEAKETNITADKKPFASILENVQQNLFVVQAEVAGADKTIDKARVGEVETVTDAIEKELPPIKSFFVSGGTELAAMLDFARTLARRAERRVVGAHEEGIVAVEQHTLAYLNRLSSLLYAMARLVNHKSGITEEPP